MIIASLPSVSFFARAKRLSTIFLVALGFLRVLLEQRLDSSTSDDAKQQQLAEWTKAKFIELGPFFIKLGQQVSTRPDLFPPAWVEVFATLQDRVAPFSGEDALEIVAQEIGPVNELFVAFDLEPLATASLGQVHRAQCQSSGYIHEVVVKVQRPGVEYLVNLDLSVLRSIVQHLVLLPRLKTDLFGFLRELEKTFETELDFRLEAANTDQFRAMFPADSGILIAEVDHDRSSRRVLTMQFLPGCKISQFSGTPEQVERVAQRVVGAFLKQILMEGCFHADPHPGNVAVSTDGKFNVILYDFGMVGRLSQQTRDALLKIAALAFINDAEGVVAESVKAGILDKKVLNNREVLLVIERFISDLGNVSAEQIGGLMQQLSNASESGGIKFPSELILLGRALVAVEGLLRQLQSVSPSLDLAAVIKSEIGPLGAQMLGQPSDPLGRIGYDSERLVRGLMALARLLAGVFAQIENGRVQISVKDAESAAALRKLRFGMKSVSSAVFSAVFFNQSIRILDELLQEIDGGHRLLMRGALCLAVLSLAVVWLERWYKSQNMMDPTE